MVIHYCPVVTTVSLSVLPIHEEDSAWKDDPEHKRDEQLHSLYVVRDQFSYKPQCSDDEIAHQDCPLPDRPFGFPLLLQRKGRIPETNEEQHQQSRD